MLDPNPHLPPSKERAQLLVLAGGLAAIAVTFAFFLGARVFPGVLLALAALALTGAVLHRRIGHDVYLVFALIALAVGRIISPVVVFLAYLLGVSLVGLILRAFGMDKLKRDFIRCREAPTMFVDPPHTPPESFRRQS
jgi:hypothetical protein